MRLILLTVLTMVAFAANSVLNRAALASGSIDAVSFGVIRLWAGALTLLVLALVLRRSFQLAGEGRLGGVLGLILYIFGFSVAYVSLDSGVGALILFGTVQITMFAGAFLVGERAPLQRWAGAAIAFGGLAWLLWPGGGTELSLFHAVAMTVAGIGWGIYSLEGRKAKDPLMSTAANFVIVAPIATLLTLFLPTAPDVVTPTLMGWVLAIVAGAVTSGLGYALWYSVLPHLTRSVAAVAQLTVPVVAMAGGMVFLGEALTSAFAIASVVVLGGVALSVLPMGRGAK